MKKSHAQTDNLYYNYKKKILKQIYSISQSVQLIFIKKLLTPPLKLEILGPDLTTKGSKFYMSTDECD